MRKLLLAILLPLAGCAAPTYKVTEPFADLNDHTRVSVSEKPDGYLVAIVMSRYQFIPDGGPLALECRDTTLATAREEATRRGRKITGPDEQRMQLSTGRNMLTGSNTCIATLPVAWAQ